MCEDGRRQCILLLLFLPVTLSNLMGMSPSLLETLQSWLTCHNALLSLPEILCNTGFSSPSCCIGVSHPPGSHIPARVSSNPFICIYSIAHVPIFKADLPLTYHWISISRGPWVVSAWFLTHFKHYVLKTKVIAFPLDYFFLPTCSFLLVLLNTYALKITVFSLYRSSVPQPVTNCGTLYTIWQIK